MSMSLEEIQQAIAALKRSDRFSLWRWLDDECGDREAEASVEAAWDAGMPAGSRKSKTAKFSSFLETNSTVEPRSYSGS